MRAGGQDANLSLCLTGKAVSGCHVHLEPIALGRGDLVLDSRHNATIVGVEPIAPIEQILPARCRQRRAARTCKTNPRARGANRRNELAVVGKEGMIPLGWIVSASVPRSVARANRRNELTIIRVIGMAPIGGIGPSCPWSVAHGKRRNNAMV
jgi:hypothetical protein